MMKKRILNHEEGCIILLLVTASIFVLICSTTTTPLMPIPEGGDSAMFQTIGKYWAQGVCPYTGLWDSKGPMIFFINAIGYWMTGTKTGVFVLQVFNMMAVSVITFKMLKKQLNDIGALWGTLLFLLVILLDYGVGNTVEEYCLPLLMISYLMIYDWSCSWCKNWGAEHPPRAAFIYGLCFAICFLTRVTNAVSLCAVVFVIVCVLIANRSWRNLLMNAGAFIGGTACLILPFAMYFAKNGALGEMWYGTIGYNLEYTEASGLKWKTMTSVIEGCLGYCGSIFLLAIGFIMIISSRNRRKSGVLWIASAVIMLVYLMNTNGYLHYALVAAPFFPITIIEIVGLLREIPERKNKAVLHGLIILICAVSLVSGAWGMRGRLGDYYYEYYRLPRGIDIEPNEVALALCEQIPSKERMSFSAYDCQPGLYLHMDVCPRYRFFTMQDWAAKCSTTLKPKMLETYQNGDAKWVLISTGSDVDVYEIIQSRYSLWDQVQIPYSKEYYQLFRMNE